VNAAAVDLDAVLGDTRPLYAAWLDEIARKLRVELAGADEAMLDERVGNWRPLLERFAEEHAAVYLRPRGAANAALRQLAARGVRVGAFTEAPEPLARVAAAQLGAGRHLEALESGPGSLERLLERLGADAAVVRSVDELRRVGA
jgi:phosphoglycolate phosphatase-like HAD superfamily hydrolase